MILQKKHSVEIEIPEGEVGLVSSMDVFHAGIVKKMSVQVNISHPFIGDLSLALTAPNGETVSLQHPEGGSSDDINMTYEGEIFDPILGSESNGRWTLTVKDLSPRDQGVLHDWTINLTCPEVTNIQSEVFIPDGGVALRSVQLCKVKGKVTDINCFVAIEHPFVGDLEISLFAPSGKNVVLHNRGGGSSDNINTTYGADILAEMMGESTEGAWELHVKDFAPRDSGMLKAWKLNLDYTQPDDLKKIEGIGPKIEQLLNNRGIYTFTRLSASEYDELKGILNDAGERYQMHDPGTWSKQAGLAALGHWEMLKQWQKELDGGIVK
jgi:subtilisin-like proprotein convertase family protein